MRRGLIIVVLVWATNLAAQEAVDHYLRGNDYAQAKRYAEAIQEYNKALSLNPYYKEAYNRLGQAYLFKKLPKQAIQPLKKAITLDPDYRDAYNNLGQVYEALGNLSKAEATYRQVFKFDSTDLPAHFNLARVLNKQNRITEGIQEYKTAIKIDPRHFLSYLHLGDVYFNVLHSPGEALFYYQRALELKPDDEALYLRLAALYKKQGQLDKATPMYQSALKLTPSNIKVLTQSGRFYLEHNNYHSARPCYDKLVGFTPSNPLVHYHRGIAYKGLKQYQTALISFAKAFKLNPYDELACMQKEKTLFLLQQPVSSPLRKEASLIHLQLADQYYQNLLLDLAKYEYQNALKLNPQNFKARLNLSLVYEKEGFWQLALDELRRAIELEPNLTQTKEMINNLTTLTENSLASKENVNLDLLPLAVDKLLINLYPSTCDHLDVGQIANEIAVSLFKQYPQIGVVERFYQKRELKDLIPLAEKEGARFVLFGDIQEKQQSFRVEASLIDLKDIKTIAHFALPLKDNYKMTKSLAMLVRKTVKAFPLRGKIFRIDDDKVMINLGKYQGFKEKQILEILRPGVKKPIGQIKIIQADQTISLARITTPRAIYFVHLNDLVKPIVAKLAKEKPKSKKR